MYIINSLVNKLSLYIQMHIGSQAYLSSAIIALGLAGLTLVVHMCTSQCVLRGLGVGLARGFPLFLALCLAVQCVPILSAQVTATVTGWHIQFICIV